MSERKYCHLVTVDTGEGLRVVQVKDTSVYVDDMVAIDTGEIGPVIAEIYAEIGGDEYTFIGNLTPIYEATGVYRHSWSREEAHADS